MEREERPEMIEECPPLENLLTSLNRDQLQSLVLTLAKREPSLVDVIKGEVRLLRSSSPGTGTVPSPPAPPPRVEVDPKGVSRQVRSILHSLDRMRSSEAYGYVGAVVNEVGRILDQAWTLIQANDGRNALTILEAITKEYMTEWENLDDSDGEASDFFNDLAAAWTEAVLSVDLTQQERQSWAKQLESWQEELDDYGIDDGFAMASTAALQGWDDPDLVRVLQGTIPEKGAWDDETWDDEAREYADDLTKARLNVLERRGHWQEYLYLAQAEDQVQAYATMLVRLGRIQEAVTYGLTNLRTTEVALALAKALFEHNEQEHGLHIAEHGLTLESFKAPLAKWLRDQAVAMGKKELALTSAEIAFREEVSLDNYLHVTQTAGEQWPQLRVVLLDYARHKKSSYPQGQVDVFLHEGLIDDAIAALEPYTSHTLVERVVDAALTSRPDWAIQACREQAESIMDGGRAQYYDAAANWLAKARKAYHVMSREQEWRVYLNELLIRHGRKYKLIPMLKALQ